MRYALVLFLALPAVYSVFIDVVFDLHLEHVLKECRHSDEKCKLGYAISLLESQGTFELLPLMLQDGTMRQTYGRRHLTESTVVKVPKVKSKDSNLYIGIKFYGLPPVAQDYYVIDVGTVLAKRHGEKSKMSLATDSLVFTTRMKKGRKEIVESKEGFFCQGDTCGCCEHLEIKQFHLNDTVCVNITYLPKEIGIDLSFSINGHVYYEDKVSVKNPPPICFAIPGLKEYASICLRFYNVSFSDDSFSACVELEAELYHVKVTKFNMGCFHIGPISNKIS